MTLFDYIFRLIFDFKSLFNHIPDAHYAIWLSKHEVDIFCILAIYSLTLQHHLT